MNQVFAWPVGPDEKHPRPHALVYLLAAGVGGVLLGMALGVVVVAAQLLPPGAVGFAMGGLAFMAAALQAADTMGFLPQRDVQVPSSWLKRGRFKAALAYGLTLGFGGATRLRYAVYAVIAAIVVVGNAAVALAAGLSFGIARGVVPLLVGTVRTEPTAAAVEGFLTSRAFSVQARIALTAVSLAMVATIVIHATAAPVRLG